MARRVKGLTMKLIVLALSVGAPACELQESTIVEVEDVVVAEVYVEIGQGLLGRNRVYGFLHRTIGGLGAGFHEVEGARLSLTRDDGSVFEFAETALETCVTSLPVEGTGTCYWLAPSVAALLVPGEALELTIALADGGVLRSLAVIPGDFAVQGVAEGGRCLLPPATPLEVSWSQAANAWAYINETEITGMLAAFALLGIPVDSDTLALVGLSISSSDTTIVFPGEFGIFNRFELDQAIATTLQQGLPAGTRAAVTISAADRNYVNWVRGGNFNPSGQVRVPSVRGDGTGVFAATVTRTFEVVVNPDVTGGAYDAPACPVG
jgi:hypothetical protein